MIDFISTYENLLLNAGISSIFALSMYIVLRSGVFSVATVGAAALGAYGSAQATLHGVALVPALAFGVVLAMAASLVLAILVLRLTYIYLAIATLAFNGIVSFLLVHGGTLTGGALGLSLPAKVGLAEVYGVLLAVVVWFVLFERSSAGRLSLAAGSDPVALSSLGYPAERIKLYALVSSLALAGLGGGLHAHFSYLVAPQDYSFALVIAVLSFVILGGLAAFWGPVLGAVLLTLLPEVFQFAGTSRELISALIVLFVIAVYPQGIVGLTRRVGALVAEAYAAVRRRLSFAAPVKDIERPKTGGSSSVE